MPRKTLLVFCFIISIAARSSAQSISHSAGNTSSVIWSKLEDLGYYETVVLSHSDITYFPRINFLETGKLSLSVGTPIGAGISFVSDLGTGESSFFWAYDLQAVLDLNIGAGSGKSNNDKFGVYVGGGYGYTSTNWEYDLYLGKKVKSKGPLARAGIRLAFPESKFGMTIGTYFKVGTEVEKFKTLGFHLLFDF